MTDEKQMRIGIPKGSLEEATVKLFAKAGWKVTSHHRNYFPEINDPELTCSLCRAQEMARYVESGLLDAGLTGKDWILENQSDVIIVDDLIATGGTINATSAMIRRCGAEPVRAFSVIGLPFLNYMETVRDLPIDPLIEYFGE